MISLPAIFDRLMRIFLITQH